MNGNIASRRKLTLLLIGVLYSGLFITPASASPIRVYVDPPEILNPSLIPGTQFSIDITVDYVEQLWAYQFWLSFNPEVLHGVSVENGPFLGSAGGDVWSMPGQGFDNDVGELKIFGAFIYFQNVLPEHLLPIGGGTLATVTFEVVGYGSSPITLGPETGLANKTGGWEFNGEWCHGWIREEEFPGGPWIWVPYEPWRNSLGHGYFDNTVQILTATVDIDPDTLNLKSKGKWITAYIELPEDYCASDIDISTVMLNSEIPAELHPTEIGDYDADSIPDLMVKFGRAEVVALLSAGEAALTITGEADGIPFEGSDAIRVIGE